MTIDPQHKPPGQQTTVSLQSPPAVKPSLHTFRVFRMPSPNRAQGRRLLVGLSCPAKHVDAADVCFLVHFSSVLHMDFFFLKKNSARWEGADHTRPLTFRENCTVWNTGFGLWSKKKSCFNYTFLQILSFADENRALISSSLYLEDALAFSASFRATFLIRWAFQKHRGQRVTAAGGAETANYHPARNIPALNQLPLSSDLQVTVWLLPQTPSLMLGEGWKQAWLKC